jgi:hypothetical protein
MQHRFLLYLWMTSIKKFFFYISMLDREYNKIGKKIDYSCKSYIFRRILILLMNMLNSFDVSWIKYEDMILRPLSSISFWILYSNNRDILNTTTNLNITLNNNIIAVDRSKVFSYIFHSGSLWRSFRLLFQLTYILRKKEGHNINYIFIIFLFETRLSTIVLHSIIRNS